jgi:hypothetical protein
MALRSEASRAGFALSVAEIFANPDLADMAEVLGSSPSPSTGSSSPLASTSPSTPPDDVTEVERFSLLSKLGLSPTDEFLGDVGQECDISVDEIEDVFPASPMQEALMALSSSRSRQGGYALHAAFALPAELDLARFVRAWERTVSLYPILRSRIISKPQGALVVVIRTLPAVYQATSELLNEHLTQQREQTFTYGSPLFRLDILDESTSKSRYLILNAHHSIYDGWSMKLIWQTVLDLYSSNPFPSLSPSPSPSFQSFIEELSLQDPSSSSTYWKQTLVDDEETSKFPLVPASHSPIASASLIFRFPYNAQTTRTLSITPSELINAVWALTLSQYTSSASVVYGVTLSGRDVALPGAERIVGPTITTVPRRVDVRGSLPEFLRHVQRVAADALPHQHLGLQCIRDLSPAARRACDFTSLLIVTPGSVVDSSTMGHVGIVPVPITAADFHPYPIALDCRPDNEILEVEVAFDPE